MRLCNGQPGFDSAVHKIGSAGAMRMQVYETG